MIPCKREWQPTPVFLPGVSHGQRSLVGYSPWGHKESDTTEWLTHTPLQKELEKQAPQSPAQFFSFFQTSKFPEMLWPQGHHFSHFSEIYFLCCKSIWHIQFSWAHSVSAFFLGMCLLVTRSCSALSDPMDCSPPGSSVHGLLLHGRQILYCLSHQGRPIFLGPCSKGIWHLGRPTVVDSRNRWTSW